MDVDYYSPSPDERFPFATLPDQPAMPGAHQNAAFVDPRLYRPYPDAYYSPAPFDVSPCQQTHTLYDQTSYPYPGLESATLVPCPETSDGPWAEYSLIAHPEPPCPHVSTEHYAPSGRAYTYPITVSYTLAHGLGYPPNNDPKSGLNLMVKQEPQEPHVKEEPCSSPMDMETNSPEFRRWHPHAASHKVDPYSATPRYATSYTPNPASVSSSAPDYTISCNDDKAANCESKMGALMDSLRPPPGVAISHTQFMSYSPAREAARSLPPIDQQSAFFGEDHSLRMNRNSISPTLSASDTVATSTWIAHDQPIVVPSQAHLAGPLPSILTSSLMTSSPAPMDSPDTPSLVTSPSPPISPAMPMSPATLMGPSSSRPPHARTHSNSHPRIHRRRASSPNTHPHVAHCSRSRSPSPKVRLSPNPAARKLPDKKPALACLFCRGRKIACGPPLPGSTDKTCNQCARRHLKCEYPVESRRGMRKRKTTFSPTPALSSSTAPTTSSASLNPGAQPTAATRQQPRTQLQALAPTQSVLNLGPRPGHIGTDMDVDLDPPDAGKSEP